MVLACLHRPVRMEHVMQGMNVRTKVAPDMVPVQEVMVFVVFVS